MIHGEPIDLPQHPGGEDAVQVKGHDDRDPRPDGLADALKEEALGVEFAVRPHTAAHQEAASGDPAGRRAGSSPARSPPVPPPVTLRREGEPPPPRPPPEGAPARNSPANRSHPRR